MSTISGMLGLTLPGMIDEPGCTAGRAISARPVVGPLESSRRSFAIRISSHARSRSAPDNSTTGAWLCIASNRSAAGTTSRPVSSAMWATAVAA